MESGWGEEAEDKPRPHILRSELMQQEFAQIFTFMQDSQGIFILQNCTMEYGKERLQLSFHLRHIVFLLTQ